MVAVSVAVPPAGTVMLAALKVTDEAALRKLGSERVGPGREGEPRAMG